MRAEMRLSVSVCELERCRQALAASQALCVRVSAEAAAERAQREQEHSRNIVRLKEAHLAKALEWNAEKQRLLVEIAALKRQLQTDGSDSEGSFHSAAGPPL